MRSIPIETCRSIILIAAKTSENTHDDWFLILDADITMPTLSRAVVALTYLTLLKGAHFLESHIENVNVLIALVYQKEPYRFLLIISFIGLTDLGGRVCP